MGDHVREKDGMGAVLAWLSILAKKNEGKSDLVTVKDIAVEHWNEFGRNYFCRYDYEGCDSESANKMMDHLRTTVIPGAKEGTAMGPFTVAQADDFEYTDPIDGSVASKQGVRIVFSDGSRTSSGSPVPGPRAPPSGCTSSSTRRTRPRCSSMRRRPSSQSLRPRWRSPSSRNSPGGTSPPSSPNPNAFTPLNFAMTQ